MTKENKSQNAFIGENSIDTNDRVRDGLALLKQLLTDETEQGYLTLNQPTLSGIHWLLTDLQTALSVKFVDDNNQPKS